MVVATAGQTSLEAAACGTPAVLVALDGPQADQGARLAAGRGRAARGDGRRPDGAARAAAALAADAAARAAMSAAGQAAVDGHGALRVAYRLGRAQASRSSVTSASTTLSCSSGVSAGKHGSERQPA